MSGRDDTTGGATEAEGESARGGVAMRLVFLLPVLLFLVVAGYFLWGLQPDRNPRDVPSALVGKPVPAFDLPAVAGLGLPGVSRAAILAHDGPVILNVFASWCAPCRIEHPIWMRLSEQGDVPIYGLNYKDAAPDARQWLANYGNPYTRVGAMDEQNANVGIDLGIYGVPETYIIDAEGIIRFKYAGPVTGNILRDKILPHLEKAR
jgi:cytochrome c biogenesis protein CcmG/thiol:disulfide interchange protein DsbE